MTNHNEIKFECEGEVYFNDNLAIAFFLQEEIVFLNDFWWVKKTGNNKDLCDKISVNVLLNDVFCRASDSEVLTFDQIEPLYDLVMQNRYIGPVVWAMNVRKQLPMECWVKDINRTGIWSVDNIVKSWENNENTN